MPKEIDFFISYAIRDLAWAEWVDFRLRRAGYSTIVQFADFRAGHNIVSKMHTALRSAKQVIGILSPRYLESSFAAAEWMAAVREDPLGEKRTLLFVRIEECSLSGLLGNIIYIDLVGLNEQEAENKLLREVRPTLPVRHLAPQFPGASSFTPVFPPSLPRYWHVPLTRKPHFVGRSDVIKDLAKAFSSDTSQLLQAVTGMGGVGKTRTAVEYCYQQRDNYDVIWWVEASAERLIHQALTRLGKALSVVDSDEVLNREDLIQRIESGLRGLRWLLIFDSVENPNAVLGRVPHLPNGHIIVTSRNPLWLSSGSVVEVRPLERVHSIEFLTARSGDDDRESANKLSEQLGDLPIALEQAAAYVERARCGLKSYSTRFAKRRIAGKEFDDETERTIAAVWRISLRRILYEEPLAFWLIQVLAFFGPHRIPLQLLQAEREMEVPFALRVLLRLLFGLLRFLFRIFDDVSLIQYRPIGKTYSVESVLNTLRRYALVEINQGEVLLHPLVRSVIQSSVRQRHRPDIIKQCAEFLSDSLASPYDINETSKLWSLHAIAVGKNAQDAGAANRVLVTILLRAAEFSAVSATDKVSEGPEIIQLALELAKALPLADRFTWEVTCLLKLVSAYREDNFSEAAERLRKAMNLLLEEESPYKGLVVLALAEYGALLLLDYETLYAGRFYEAAIAVERQDGPSVFLAGLLRDYAMILRVAGEFDEAESMAVEALSMSGELLGPTHPLVANHRFSLGVIQSSRGDPITARKNLEAAYSVSSEVFGDESQHVRSIETELQSLEHPEWRQATARLFQTPRTPEESKFASQADSSFPVGEVLPFLYESARDIAFEHMRSLVMPAILRSGLASIASDTGSSNSFGLSITQPPADAKKVGLALAGVIVPIYQAIANDPRWEDPDQPGLALFREEMLNQYAHAFRRTMTFRLATSAKSFKKLGPFLRRSPSFEEFLSFFRRNVQDFFKLIPECFVEFERKVVSGDMEGSRRGIHGIALQCDAPFYLRHLVEKVGIPEGSRLESLNVPAQPPGSSQQPVVKTDDRM